MTIPNWVGAGFALFVLAVLALDLGVFHRRARSVGCKEALGWAVVWFSLAALFGGVLWHSAGRQKGEEFITGYFIELSLSADNVFVFVLIFNYFAVPAAYQHQVLFWGVLGAMVMRVLMIVLGVSLLQRFVWIFYFFGGFLVFTGLKMIFGKEKEARPEQNPVVRWVTGWVPVAHGYHAEKFFLKVQGKVLATRLFVVLICVEVSDLLFAVDSIPAIFAVTLDPFIVYSANVFAILGLRSLYSLLSGVMDKFYYLRTGLGVVLGFVGFKMFLAHTAYAINTLWALAVVATVLAISLAASWMRAGGYHDKTRRSTKSART
jgi:tellurite resistance protein TerC